jgi:ATP-binding cassette subfamily F protein 3
MSLVVVKDVYKSFGSRDVLQGVTLAVSPGERVALLGRNGCGKSTLLRIIAGHLQPDTGHVQLAKRARLGFLTQGLDDLGDADALTETAKGLGELLQLEEELHRLTAALEQHSSDPQLLRQYGSAEAEFRLRDGYTWQQRVKAMLMGLGLPEDALHRSAELLSGGERMRLALARLFLKEPDILLLDEPTNHLDLGATEWLEGFLRSYRGACLVVSHDRYFLDAVSERVVELEGGVSTEYRGNFSAYSQEKARRAAEQDTAAAGLGWQIRHEQQMVSRLKEMGRHKAAASRAKALQRKKQALPARVSDEKQPVIGFRQPDWVSNLIAEGVDVVKEYDGVEVLTGATFEIAGGERVGIIGPNGAGKTTLLRLLVGEEQPTSGHVRLGPWVRWVYLGQTVQFADPERTVLAELLAVAPEMGEGVARSALARFLFPGDTVFQHIESLSGGEKSRLALLCAIQSEPHCLILDEPTNHLDIPSRECLEEALASFRGTVIAVSHDRFFLNRVVTRIMEFRDGKILSASGNYNAYRKALALAASPTAGGRAAATSKVSPGQKAAVRNVVVTGRQLAPKGKSRRSKVREYGKERAVDLEKRIAATEERIGELEAKFQEPGFYRQRSSHQALEEHQHLVEQLSVLLEARDGQLE